MSTNETRVRKIDPNFQLPKELQFAVYSEETGNVLVGDTAEGDTDIDVGVDSDDIDEDESSDELDVPAILGIVSQTVRAGADGRTVVDVVLSVEDVFGATKYDVRVSK